MQERKFEIDLDSGFQLGPTIAVSVFFGELAWFWCYHLGPWAWTLLKVWAGQAGKI